MGVGMVRVSPQATGTLDVIGLLDGIRAGTREAAPSGITPAGAEVSNGYWSGQPGIC
ncbi:hypothetical protein [Cupriavidus necator]|nr:hypothetical protein [Cupriavidus necator]MDX6007174.1 hypothetical protein [Cupriavidus necator]